MHIPKYEPAHCNCQKDLLKPLKLIIVLGNRLIMCICLTWAKALTSHGQLFKVFGGLIMHIIRTWAKALHKALPLVMGDPLWACMWTQ